jgi:hypothetical protein
LVCLFEQDVSDNRRRHRGNRALRLTLDSMPTAGDVLVSSIVADLAGQQLAPDAREVELLERARAAVDRIAELEGIVALEGMTYTDKAGVVRPSPLLAEIRSTTIVLTRCLGGIQMNAFAVAKDPVKQRAGLKSWAVRSAVGPA